MRRKSFKWLLAGAIVFLVLLLPVACIIAAKYLEIAEIGERYLAVAQTDLKAALLSRASGFSALFISFMINTLIIRRIMLKRGSELSLITKKRAALIMCLALSAVMAPLVGGSAGRQFLEFANSTPFNMKDPIFGKDIGYYVFQRPFLLALSNSALSVLLIQIVFCALFYTFLYVQKDLDEFRAIIGEKSIIAHNLINIMIFFLAKALTYRLKSEELLFSSFAGLKGAGFTAIQVWHKYNSLAPYLILAILLIGAAFLLKKRYLPALYTILAFPVFWAGFGVVAWGVQVMLVNPYELSMEGRYIDYNIQSTRNAFAITQMDIAAAPFEPGEELGEKNLKAYAKEIERLPIFDEKMDISAANALQSIKDFYHFKNSAVTKYAIAGRDEAVSISPREIDTGRLGSFDKSYVNLRLRYTHGYGLVMRSITRLTDEGQPKYFIKDIPVKSYEGAPAVTQPRIYYGELTNGYVISNSAYKEMDYPEGDKTAEYSYTGSGGIPMTFFKRLVFAVKHMDVMMIASGYLNDDSRLMDNRNILKRVKKAAPFLEYDESPYMLIDGEGRLKWVVDAYTATNDYPYSQTRSGINYIRNSARAVVDAYDGTVDIYMTDTTDPIINTYSKIYPGVIRREPFPRDLQGSLRAAPMLFEIKSDMYKKYRETSADSFYFKTTQWVQSGEPHYAFVKTADGREKFSLLLAYAQKDKGGLAALLIADAEGESGGMRLLKFPKEAAANDIETIDNKIENDPAISKEISLWTQGGAVVARGGLGVNLIGNSLVYIKPVYVESKSPSSPPEVKRVIAFYAGRAAMEETAQKALEVILGRAKPAPESADISARDLVSGLISQYNDMRNFAAEGDWEAFGKKMDELDETIKALGEVKDEIMLAPAENE